MKAVELLLRRFDHEFRKAEAGDERLGARGHAGNVAGDDRMIGRNGRALEPADDDFLQRIPLIVGIDWTVRGNRGPHRCMHIHNAPRIVSSE